MKVLIEQIKTGEEKSGTGKNGKPYKLQNFGIKTGGTWHNGTVFGSDIETVKKWQSGQEVEIDLFDEPYKDKSGVDQIAKKFRLPKKQGGMSAEVVEKIERIEKAMELMYRKIVEIEKSVTRIEKTSLPL